MKSSLRLALISALILASTAPVLTACAGGPVLAAPTAACSTLVPSSHRKDVDSAEPPALDAQAGAVWAFADAQTGQLDKANGHTADVLEIVERCETRDRAAVAHLQAPFWKRPFLRTP